MKLLTTTTRKLAASASGAVLLAGGGAGAALALAGPAAPAVTAAAVAQAPPGSPEAAGLQILASASSPPARGAAPAKPPRHRPAPAIGRIAAIVGRTDHATFEVKRKGSWVTLTYDRGKVTAVSSSSITVRRPDGHSVTIALASTTHYRGPTSAGTIATNQPVAVISDNGTALWVGQPKPAAPKPAAPKPAAPKPAAPKPAVPNSTTAS